MTAPATNDGLKVTLLGTGSPRPNVLRAHPAQIVHFGEKAILVDCGDAVTTQVLAAGFDLVKLQRIILTHLHWDHVLGYPGIVWGGWTMGRPGLEVWGPPGTRAMHDMFFKGFYRTDIEYAINLGYSRDGMDGILVNEIQSGVIFDAEGLVVRAATVPHSVETFALRFEYGGKVLVLSADTVHGDAIIEIAKGADLLVHEATVVPNPVYTDERSRRILAQLITDHSTPAQAGIVARKAGVKKLALTHLLPSANAERVRSEAATEYDGPITVANDFMTISC